jgi:hypothetical protein
MYWEYTLERLSTTNSIFEGENDARIDDLFLESPLKVVNIIKLITSKITINLFIITSTYRIEQERHAYYRLIV